MMYEDAYGRLWHPWDAEKLSPHQIEEIGFHINERYGEA